MRHKIVAVLLGVAALVAGCAGTRSMRVGLLPNSERLVTLVVTQDLQVVRRECLNVQRSGQVLGCQMSHPTSLPGGDAVMLVKIVRYTDALPSAPAFALDAEQVCRTLAVLQSVRISCGADEVTALNPTRSPGAAVRTP